MTSTSAEYESVYGKVSTRWKDDGKVFSLDVTIPANTSAAVTVPGSSSSEVYEGGKLVASQAGVGGHTVQIEAGAYHFESREQ